MNDSISNGFIPYTDLIKRTTGQWTFHEGTFISETTQINNNAATTDEKLLIKWPINDRGEHFVAKL